MGRGERAWPSADSAALAARPGGPRATSRPASSELNSRLNRWETIKDFRILDHDLTVEAGELTPSLKLKRRVVEQRYKAVLDSMYASHRPLPGVRALTRAYSTLRSRLAHGS